MMKFKKMIQKAREIRNQMNQKTPQLATGYIQNKAPTSLSPNDILKTDKHIARYGSILLYSAPGVSLFSFRSFYSLAFMNVQFQNPRTPIINANIAIMMKKNVKNGAMSITTCLIMVTRTEYRPNILRRFIVLIRANTRTKVIDAVFVILSGQNRNWNTIFVMPMY